MHTTKVQNFISVKCMKKCGEKFSIRVGGAEIRSEESKQVESTGQSLVGGPGTSSPEARAYYHLFSLKVDAISWGLLI